MCFNFSSHVCWLSMFFSETDRMAHPIWWWRPTQITIFGCNTVLKARGEKKHAERILQFLGTFFFFFTLVIFLSIQVVHKWCVSPGPCLLIPCDSSPFLPCHNSESGDQNNMSNLGHPPPQKYIYRCRVFHRASAYSNTSASAPQTPGLCLSLNIYFQRINARGRQVLSPRQKGDIRNSNTGVQTHIFAPLTGFRRQRYLCFSFFFVAPPALASR